MTLYAYVESCCLDTGAVREYWVAESQEPSLLNRLFGLGRMLNSGGRISFPSPHLLEEYLERATGPVVTRRLPQGVRCSEHFPCADVLRVPLARAQDREYGMH